MCGRLNVTADPLAALLMEAFSIAATPETNHNLAPSEPLLVVRAAPAGNYESRVMRWWLTPSWSKELNTRYAMFNARSETLAQKRAFAKPFRSQRCLVPVTGYYEWQTRQREKLPFYVRAAQDQGLMLAGLWDSWTNPATGERIDSCTIVTSAAHDDLRALHHRQPVFLSSAQAKAWLEPDVDPASLMPLFAPHLPVPLALDPVSSYVNNARQKSSRALVPIAPTLPVDRHLADLLASEDGRTRSQVPQHGDFFEDS